MKTTQTLGEMMTTTVRGVTLKVYATLSGYSVGAAASVDHLATEHGLTFDQVPDALSRVEYAVRSASL